MHTFAMNVVNQLRMQIMRMIRSCRMHQWNM